MDASTGTDSASSLHKNNETLISSSHCFLREVIGGENWLQWHAVMDRSGIYDLQAFVTWLLKIADAKLMQGMSTESTNTVGTSTVDRRWFSKVDAEKLQKQLEKKPESDKVGMQESDRKGGGSDAEFELAEGNEEESDVVQLADAQEKETRDKCDIDEHEEECKEHVEDDQHEKNNDGDKCETLEHRQVEEKKQVKKIGKIICDRLVDAVRSGDVHTTGELLDMIDPQEKAEIINTTTDMCDRNNPALMAIAIDKGYEMVEILTKHGADVSNIKCDASGNTPLMLACRKGDKDSVKLMLKHGAAASVDDKIANGETPLTVACRAGHVEIANALLESGAQVVPVARALGNVDLARILLAHGADKFINEIDVETGKLPIMVATEGGDVDMTNLLLEYGAGQSLNQTDVKTSRTPLMKACVDRNVDMVKLLLEHGAGQSVNQVDVKTCMTPIINACWSNNVDMVKLLLEHGAGQSVNHADVKTGMTPIINACWINNVDMVKLLLKHGAGQSVNHADRNGVLPLHVVCKQGNVDILQALLEHGAGQSVCHMDIWGVNALIRACNSETPNRNAIVKILLQHGAPVDHADSDGQTALQIAAGDKEVGAEVVEMLLHAGASCDLKNKCDGQTALHIAAVRGNLRVVQLLIQAGASCYEKDNGGLDWCDGEFFGDNDGRTPLELARCRAGGNDRVINYIKNWMEKK